jgi:hypothetical protein
MYGLGYFAHNTRQLIPAQVVCDGKRGARLHLTQAQPVRDPFQSLEAECDVLFQIHSQGGGTVYDVFAFDAAGEGFIFHLLSDGLGLYLPSDFPGLTSAHAVMNPASSSQAKSAFSIGVSRVTPEYSA